MKCKFFQSFLYVAMVACVSGLQIRPPTSPLQNIAVFDPSNYEGGLEPSFYRESELKHGRLAMMGTVLFPLLEHTQGTLGINAFQSLSDNVQLSVVYTMFACEFYTMLIGWENPVVKAFTLKENYQPGDFEFPWNKLNGDVMDKELNNGRLAMIGMLGMMVQELVTQQPLF